MAVEVEVHDPRRLPQHVIVQGSHLDSARVQRVDHAIDLAFEQHEIAHHHRLVERDPGAEGEGRADGDAVDANGPIDAREAGLVDAIRLHRACAPEGLRDGSPVSGRSGEKEEGGEKNAHACMAFTTETMLEYSRS